MPIGGRKGGFGGGRSHGGFGRSHGHSFGRSHGGFSRSHGGFGRSHGHNGFGHSKFGLLGYNSPGIGLHGTGHHHSSGNSGVHHGHCRRKGRTATIVLDPNWDLKTSPNGEFESGLCNCCENCNDFCVAWCFPCILDCTIANTVGS